MTEFILKLMGDAGYFGIFLLMLVENVFPPIPSEVIMGLAGMGVSRGSFALWPVLLVGTAGTLAGNYFWYEVGRRLGYQGLKPWVERWGRWLTVEWQDVEKIIRFFHDRGGWVVFVFRFLPTFRTMVSLPAGMARMPHWRFSLATFGGSLIWNGALLWAGIVLDSRFSELERYIGPAAIATFAAILVFYLYRVATWRPRG
ncbi:DedA family protein [Sphingomonas aracearum]|uniref:DedA family protein n=1 Tax=Sphingomonas aracearum TaxID=2283317 RepID=A0A369W3Q2_9SPHN|nr:DedA family protein [Sphingomonas aracearum]RDE06691.1 DedA family protein [Sphingomonas aracearum]